MVCPCSKSTVNAATDPHAKGHWIRDITNAAGIGLHIPGLGQAGTTAQYLEDVRTGKEHPKDAAEMIHGIITGHGAKH